MEHVFISTPIYYVNARPHLGHAYTTIVADCLSRYHKAMGRDVFFLTGTDEHGDKIVQAAEKNGISPEAYATSVSREFQELWPRLGIENSDFIRTTEPRHIACVQAILQKVYDAGDIYFGEYGGQYCYGCERFLTEKELVDAKCPDHQTAPEEIYEKNYFFRMSKYQGWLIDHINANPDYIRPERYRKEVLAMLEAGVLEDLCISRPKSRLTWGIELPFDPDFVCYVWFDALINYITALGYPDDRRFHDYWPNANHFVAKDILKPHAIFWPTMLKAAGIEPYKHLNVHGYWLARETKMSKSLGNVVDPLAMAEKYGLSAFRYFLLREMHFGNDASFSEEGLVSRLNADLANDLGNLFSRTLAMTRKYFDGRIPGQGEAGSAEEEIRAQAFNAMANCQTLFEQCRFDRSLEALWELVRGLNKYIDASAPWQLHKEGRTGELAAVLRTLLEAMRKVALHLWPVMPDACEQMLKQLGVTPNPEALDLPSEIDTWNQLPEGAEVAAASNLFPRVDLEKSSAQDESTSASPKKGKKQQSKPAKKDAGGQVEFADFQKLDIRMGTVLGAEKHPDADKLLRLSVDVGEAEPRQIIAGLAEFHTPEGLVGRQVTVLTNLKPRKIRGLVSRGMVLAVRHGEELQLLTASDKVDNGSRVS